MPDPSDSAHHTDRDYRKELVELKDALIMMAGRVEGMIDSGCRALTERDIEMARATIAEDEKVNRAEIETDELCMRMLAKRSPAASDLRFITLALKMVTDLERIGDLAANISERAIDLATTPHIRLFHEGIPEMAKLAQSMVREAIDAFIAWDPVAARRVIERDNAVDDLYQRVFRETLEQILADPAVAATGISIQSAAKFLERIGDHGVNLAELVVFMVQGTDIRHLPPDVAV